MEKLEEYGNKIIVRGDDGQPHYLIGEPQFTEEEERLLNNSEKLFSQVELETVRKEPDIGVRERVLHEYIKMKIPDSKNRDALIEAIMNKAIGYGPLSDLIEDKNLEEVMVNGIGVPVYVFHKKHGMCSTNVVFNEKDEIFRIASRLCWAHGKELSPIVDMTAIDGNRINITSDALAMHGTAITIRKQRKNLMSITELIENGTLDLDIAALLWMGVDGMRISPANILVAGMIGSGKTTLLNALVMLSPPEDRIVTIEETSELQLAGRGNWVPLISEKNYDLEALVRNTLRMRPTRIVVGEIRGAEAMALFNAMNVGHKGMGTMHANSSRDTIFRLESPPMNVPSRIIANLDLIVIMNIFNLRGRPIRRVTEVAEVGGREGETVLLGGIYQWDPQRDRAVESEEIGPSAYLDKLAARMKVSKRDIVSEMAKRKLFLKGLVDHRITDYEQVFAAIKEFYKSELINEKNMYREPTVTGKGTKGKGR